MAGTGHRPTKILIGNRNAYKNDVMNVLVDFLIGELREINPDKVISGMALGYDTALARAALDLNIPLIAAVPFKDQDKVWIKSSREEYRVWLQMASEVVIVSEGGYSPAAMQTRNVWMCDHADSVLALWDGTSGGTGNCVGYAERAGKPISNLWNKWKEYIK